MGGGGTSGRKRRQYRNIYIQSTVLKAMTPYDSQLCGLPNY